MRQRKHKLRGQLARFVPFLRRHEILAGAGFGSAALPGSPINVILDVTP
jgi:hypothetical protein